MKEALNGKLDKLQAEIAYENEATASHLGSEALQEVLRSFDKPPKLQRLAHVLKGHDFSTRFSGGHEDEAQSEWLVLARASAVVYTTMLETLFERALPLTQDMLYWDSVLSSGLWTSLYLLQTAPSRVFTFSRSLMEQAHDQINGHDFTLGTLQRAFSDRTLLRRMAFPQLTAQKAASATKVLSIRAMVRQEVKRRRKALSLVKDAQARAIGMLVSEAMPFKSLARLEQDVVLGVSVMELLSRDLAIDSLDKLDFEEVTTIEGLGSSSATCSEVAERLVKLIENHFPKTGDVYESLTRTASRPSRHERYWPLLVAGYFGGSAFLRLVVNRQQALSQWVLEVAETAQFFWQNWIVTPIGNIIGTIRHDEGSEVALMSKKSLTADMQSLERMVVDFAQDNPEFADSADLDILRAAAREGDLTPVLRAYESNIKNPLKSTIAGTLIRSLLIQIQKTKVDVEIAINGIDKLLKSQELVFGFVGVSPALVLLWLTGRSLSNMWNKKSQVGQGQTSLNSKKIIRYERETTFKPLERMFTNGNRNIERILNCDPDNGKLSFKKQGLLLCEVQILRSYAKNVPANVRPEFLGDLHDLENGKELNIEGQRRVCDRLWRARYL